MHCKHTNANIDRKEKTNICTIRRIISKKKNSLPSLRNQNLKTVKSETEKENDLTNIPTYDITELKDFIYPGAKLVSEKIGVPSKTKKQSQNPGENLDLNR